MSNSNNKPVHEVRDGSLRIAIFRNDPKEQGQRPRYSGILTRSYRDGQGEWHDTEHLSGCEYLRAARLMMHANYAELAQRAADSHEGPELHP